MTAGRIARHSATRRPDVGNALGNAGDGLRWGERATGGRHPPPRGRVASRCLPEACRACTTWVQAPEVPYPSSASTVCGTWLAWANMAVADCTMMLLRVNWVISFAMSASRITDSAAVSSSALMRN